MPEEVKKSLIGDIAGLSEPLKKLFEVVSSGVGRLTGAMWLDKRDADNEAYKILKVGSAQTQVAVDRMKAVAAIGRGSIPQVQKLTLTGNEVNAELSDGQQAVLALKERGDNRAEYQNLINQLNIERTVEFAASELEQEGAKVSKEPVDSDWIARLFDIIKNVSSENLQALWGKVLAGEIKEPNTFSLRTLDVMKNLTQKEAKLFAKICPYLAVSKQDNFTRNYSIFRGDAAGGVTLELPFSFEEFTLLIDSGLIHPDKDSVFFLGPFNEGYKLGTGFQVGNKILMIEGKLNEGVNRIRFRHYMLTNAGKEISKLVETGSADMGYLIGISKMFANYGPVTKCADFIEWTENNGILYEGELLAL